MNDSTIELFNYPLDYEIIGTGVYEPKNDSSILYTVIPVGYNLGSHIEYEVLEHCYIPGATASTDELMIEEESLRLTGNFDIKSESKARTSPEGYIKVYDTKGNTYVPVKKVKVRTHKLVNIHSAFTDENGYYKVNGKYSCDPYYEIVYENKTGFKVWGNLAFLAPTYLYLGKQSKDGFSRNINTNSAAWLWSTINNAAYIYREVVCPQFCIEKPINNLRIWATRTGGVWSGCAPMLHNITASPILITSVIALFGLNTTAGIAAGATLSLLHFTLPDIFILSNSTDTKIIHSIVFHELSHSSHYSKVGRAYWTRYISQIVQNGGYGTSPTTTNGIVGVGEMWGYYFEYVSTKYIFGSECFRIYADQYWFEPYLLKNLSDSIPELTPARLFYCLNNSITSHSQFKTEIKTNFGIFNGTDYCSQIDSIFSKYGF